MTDAPVGIRTLACDDVAQGARVALHVMYASRGGPLRERLGRYDVDVVRDGEIVGDAIPVVVISHGQGGTPWGYRGLALALARAGFAAVLLEHPGDRLGDAALAGSRAMLVHRPRHVCLALDAVYAQAALAPRLAPWTAIVGHSMGGYVALACAGGRAIALPNQTAHGVAEPIEVHREPRVRAAVLLAPALPWLMAPGALADVDIPLYVRTGELDDQTPPFFVEKVLAGLPRTTRLDYAVVPRAGHFAFFTPFPPALVSPAIPPSLDPPGFDRAEYHAQLYPEIIAFLSSERERELG